MNTGKSHGICQRHKAEIFKQMGKPAPPASEGGSFDLSQLSPQERSLLAHLNTVIKTRQQKKGVWEGRCEDYPCCGHEDGGCPDIDPQSGEEIFSCAGCGVKLPPRSPSSLCRRCLAQMRRDDDRPMYGGDYEDVF